MAKKIKSSTEPKRTDDDDIIEEARKRFKYCVDYYAEANARYLSDIKFKEGDSDNGWQWDAQDKQTRDGARRPALTINKVRQMCLDITNDARQNKPSIKVTPTGLKATGKGAGIMEGVVRYIEYKSVATTVYSTAVDTQVGGGRGYWRVLTEYADSETFDQDLVIKPIKNPLSVYPDPDVKEVDRSDMRYCFIYDDEPTESFKAKYPGVIEKVGQSTALAPDKDWIDDDHVRVCEYYRVTERRVKLIAYQDEDGVQQIIRSDKISPAIEKELLKLPGTRYRDLLDNVVEWYKIVGDMILERSIWVGSTIPVVMIIGEEYVIEQKYDCRGHVRMLKDPQRMYNYWTSAGTESVALQTKTPWVAPLRAVENLMNYWSTANTNNHSILPYNDIDDDGNPIQPPQRTPPPEMPTAYVQGMQIAAEEMRMASGQYQANLGEQANEPSGKALGMRQRAGDNATYHYIDGLAIGINYTGRILIECIPKVFDTRRLVKILGEDGSETSITIDPSAEQEYNEESLPAEQGEGEQLKVIFNPAFAKYSVQAEVGPNYATRRQEAFNAFVQIMTAQPDLMKVAGDLLFKAADFPMADELADRMRRMIPPELLGKGPSPQVVQLQQQNSLLTQHIQTMVTQYAEERAKFAKKDADSLVDEYRAETDRLKALLGGIDANQIAQLTAQLVLETMQTNLGQPPAQTPAPAQPAAPVGV